ncbi:MAG TPA: response regulator transcription factor [Ktedonobacterales bacterium]|nr:response regulator transcription factor [Ktedonobacterales bacterium]
MTRRIRVLIVDDQALLREGFRKLLELEPDIEIVDTASDGESALTAAERLHANQSLPDVILMDIQMPRMDGISAIRAFKTRWPDSHILILTTFDNTDLIYNGLRAGALGYLLKDITSEQLANAVRAAARGEVLLQPNIANKVFAALSPTPAAQPLIASSKPTAPSTGGQVEELTEREREILLLVARGATNREIGEALFITEGTVKNHMSNILSKLGLRDRTQAALYARERFHS